MQTIIVQCKTTARALRLMQEYADIRPTAKCIKVHGTIFDGDNEFILIREDNFDKLQGYRLCPHLTEDEFRAKYMRKLNLTKVMLKLNRLAEARQVALKIEFYSFISLPVISLTVSREHKGCAHTTKRSFPIHQLEIAEADFLFEELNKMCKEVEDCCASKDSNNNK